MEDQFIISEIQQGNKVAYKQMFMKYYSPLCEYASCYLDDTEAEDLVQELMLHIWETKRELLIVESLKSYLFTAVKNRSLNLIRNHQYKKKVRGDIYEDMKDYLDDFDYYMANDLSDKIQEAIQKLPDTYRQTFEMSRFGELTNAQIASHLSVSVKTVEYRITQSLKILRIELKDYIMWLVVFYFMRN